MYARRMIGINGSPRKDKTTAQLVGKALEGIASQGVETKLIHLYDLHLEGCRGCYKCKLLDSSIYGQCSQKDDLLHVIRDIKESDGLIVGSPVYFSSVTAGVKALLERLYFPLYQYVSKNSFFYREIPTGFIFCLNQPEEALKDSPTYSHLQEYLDYADRLTGPAKAIFACNTSQHDDYSRYYRDQTMIETRKKLHKESFPRYLDEAYQLGESIAGGLK